MAYEKKIKRRNPILREIEFSKLIEEKRLIKIKNQNKISKRKILFFIKLLGFNLISLKKRKINTIVKKFVNKDENKKNNGKQDIIIIEQKLFRFFFLNLFNSLNINTKIFF
tara:strand:+ start:416 stop:748 length:333 start_codon:yes stop_codon:yes gene_type:complete